MGKFTLGLMAALLVSACVVHGKDDDEKEKKKDSVGTVIGIDLGTTYSWYVYWGNLA